jgi:propane monooxygenase reductase component
MANTPATSDETGTEDYLEFIIKLYPGGRFSSLLESGLSIGDSLEVKGPYGSFMLRETSNSDLIFIGGGSGMAPLWSMLNDMAERGIQRKVTFYYGARTPKDLFYLDRLQQLAERLPGFRFVPALSDPRPEDKWEGETGFISDVVDRSLAPWQTELEAYLCGPPPMIDAAIAVLFGKGVSEDRIFFDKFTPAGEDEMAGALTRFTV